MKLCILLYRSETSTLIGKSPRSVRNNDRNSTEKGCIAGPVSQVPISEVAVLRYIAGRSSDLISYISS